MWPVLVAVAVTALLAVALVFEYRAARAEALDATRKTLLSTTFEPKRRDVEQFFTLSYQTVRTVGLLPSVRAIQGANRASADDDMVKGKRFSLEGHRTVQQLYNNLAANVSVSEVYGVLDGFDPEHEVPFFMYDELVLGPEAEKPAEPEVHTDDTPEDFEADEYAWYPRQLAELKARLPRLEVATLDDIPAVASPVMRTCDNAQYTSKAHGQVGDAAGFLYSVPFFGTDGAFRGLISTVFRTNVLEAMLVGVPRLLITADDQKNAADHHYALPERASDFVLANPARGTWIGDRREPALVERARALVGGARDDGLHSVTLAIKDSSPWVLVYRFDPVALATVDSREQTRFLVELLALVVLAISIILGPIGIYLKRARVLEVDARIAEIAAGGGDLTRRLAIERKDEVGQLGRSFDGLLDRIHDLVLNIKQSAVGVSVGAHELTKGNESVSSALQQQAASTEQLAAAISALSGAVRDTSNHAREVSSFAMKTSDVAKSSGALVGEARQAMAAVLDSSSRISSIVELVQDIAFQTNLLALNAGVEAARAGEHGRGFGVVATEVRALSERTAKATKEIRALVKESASRTGDMQKVIEKTGSSLQEVATAIRDVAGRITAIATTSEEQSGELASLKDAITRIDVSVQSNSSTAEESSSVAESLRGQADHLTQLVQQFKVRE